MNPKPIEERERETEVLVEEPCKVILFNDDLHTFEEVIVQLVKALRCDISKAESLTWEVHNNGKAAVFVGTMDECVLVSAVLEEIALFTQIEV